MMKFVIIQCAEAHHHELEKILEDIQINTYSEMHVDGFMKSVEGDSDLSNWFASSHNPYRYVVSFSFLKEDKADALLERIKVFNDNVERISPINAYVSPIEKYV